MLESQLAELVGRVWPSCQLRIWLQDNSVSELIVLKTRSEFEPNVIKMK